jgi:hypothetical protein
MNRDPRWALSQELEAKQTLLDQLRALAAEDPDFLTDLIEGKTNLLELVAALDASIVDDKILVNGAKTALDKLQARKRAAENYIELKRRLLTHTLQQIGLKTVRTPTATLTLASATIRKGWPEDLSNTLSGKKSSKRRSVWIPPKPPRKARRANASNGSAATAR